MDDFFNYNLIIKYRSNVVFYFLFTFFSFYFLSPFLCYYLNWIEISNNTVEEYYLKKILNSDWKVFHTRVHTDSKPKNSKTLSFPVWCTPKSFRKKLFTLNCTIISNPNPIPHNHHVNYNHKPIPTIDMLPKKKKIR